MYTLYTFATPAEAPTLRLFGLQRPGNATPDIFAITEETVHGPSTSLVVGHPGITDPHFLHQLCTETLSTMAWHPVPQEQAPHTAWLDTFFRAREQAIPTNRRPSNLGQWWCLHLTEREFQLAYESTLAATRWPLYSRMFQVAATVLAVILLASFLA